MKHFYFNFKQIEKIDFKCIFVFENQLRYCESISEQWRALTTKLEATENVNGNETIPERPAIDDHAAALPFDLGQNNVPDGKQCIKMAHNSFDHIEVLIVGNFLTNRTRAQI